MARPRVSVLMPAYNAARYIARAIDSVFSQTLVSWELIVVNDGSTDETGRILAGVADARVRVMTQANGGEASSRNAALRKAAGEFVAFLDADDIYLPEHLRVAVDYLDEHPDQIGVYTDGYYVDENERPLQALSSRRQSAGRRAVFHALVRSSDAFGPPVCVVLRLDPVQRRGIRFDERITIGTDWDFFTRVAEAGPIGCLDRITCLYRLHGANLTLRAGVGTRQRDIATCRSKAIQLPGFAGCPADVRVAVFYDLLVNALVGLPERQQEIVGWPQFAALPVAERARLLRLMSSKAILAGGESVAARRWLDEACALAPFDPRPRCLRALYRVAPPLCRAVLRARTSRERRRASAFRPFADLDV